MKVFKKIRCFFQIEIVPLNLLYFVIFKFKNKSLKFLIPKRLLNLRFYGPKFLIKISNFAVDF
jgi:hypothetical protein